MRRSTHLVIAAALLAAIVLLPQAAMAVGPVTTPMEILKEDFEDATMPGLTLQQVPDLTSPGKAWWGRITQRHAGGVYGLWCAGTDASGSVTPWTAFANKYRVMTWGIAELSLPQLAGYYSSTLDYSYTMPTLGSDDRDSFAIHWWPSDDPLGPKEHHTSEATTGVNAWRVRSWALSLPSNPTHNLSRTDSKANFLFRDSADNPVESPMTGEGASIDDVSVRGFKFGPVRNLSATETAGDMVLTWQTPSRSTTIGAPNEERPITYRVWRSSDTSPAVWTELTAAARISGTTLTDTGPLSGYSRYVVQAWDPGIGETGGWGEVDVAGVRVGFGALPPTTTHVLTPLPSDALNGWYVTTPTLTITRDMAGQTFFGKHAYPTSTYSSNPNSPYAFGLDQGDVTYGYFGVGAAGTTETLVHTVRIKLDSIAPVTSSDATAAYSGPAKITLSPSDGAPGSGSGVAGTRWALGGGVSTSGTVATVSSTGTQTLSWSSIDAAGNREETRSATFVVTAASTTSTLKSNTTSTYRGRTVALSGSVRPVSAAGKTVRIYVKRPGKKTYAYLTTRTMNSAANWSYSYKFSRSAARGYYYFRARFLGAPALNASSYSSARRVRVR